MINNKNRDHAIYNKSGVSHYLVGVFAKMGIGLFITFVVSWVVGVAVPEIGIRLLASPLILMIMGFAQMIISFTLFKKAKNFEANGVDVLYYLFTFLNGIILSYIYFFFNTRELMTALFTTIVFFGTLAAYGHYTKQDLSHWGTMLRVAAIALVIVSFGQLFAGMLGYYSSFLSLLISCVTVIIFTLFVAFDIQTIKKLYFSVSGNSQGERVVTTLGAFHLYLDFIIIFQHLLEIMSERKK